MLKQVEVIAPFVKRAMLCGSRVTCNPAPTDTDQDVIVLVVDTLATAQNSSRAKSAQEGYASMVRHLEAAGYVIGGSGEGDDDFESWSEGGPDNVNLILTADPAFYEKFVTATTVCRTLNLMGKSDRQMLFQAILYDQRPYSPEENGQPWAPGPDDMEFL